MKELKVSREETGIFTSNVIDRALIESLSQRYQFSRLCYFIHSVLVSSIRTPKLTQRRLEHTETNPMYFKWELT